MLRNGSRICAATLVCRKSSSVFKFHLPKSRLEWRRGKTQSLLHPQDILEHPAFRKIKEALFIVIKTLAISLSLNAKYFIRLLHLQIKSSIFSLRNPINPQLTTYPLWLCFSLSSVKFLWSWVVTLKAYHEIEFLSFWFASPKRQCKVFPL